MESNNQIHEKALSRFKPLQIFLSSSDVEKLVSIAIEETKRQISRYINEQLDLTWEEMVKDNTNREHDQAYFNGQWNLLKKVSRYIEQQP